jgi:hypothetical protein
VPTEGATQLGQDAIEKSRLATFSLAITRASFDKVTQTMRWKADASDTADDLYDDNMTLELFQDFIGRIEAGEQAPDEFSSQFWSGGMPYLSISHYPDLGGKAVPGQVERVFVDGSYLKAEGMFADTPLGRACFKSVCDDLYGQNKDGQNKVRISIAFIDYKHKHKDTGFVFERKSLDDVCPECLQNMVNAIMESGKPPHPTMQGPKEFLRGQLIHLAMTRVPVNTRTLMEVDRAMTTRLEDAESIVGELATELEEQAKLVGKSEALVIKSEGEGEAEETPELAGVPEKAKFSGKPDEEDAEDEEEPKKGKKDVKPEKADLQPVLDRLSEIKGLLTRQPHPLDAAFDALRSQYDQQVASGLGAEDILRSLQEPYAAIGETIRSVVGTKTEAPEVTEQKALSAVLERMEQLSQSVNLITARLDGLNRPASVLPEQPVAPVRRSINPQVARGPQLVQKVNSATPKLRALIDSTT